MFVNIIGINNSKLLTSMSSMFAVSLPSSEKSKAITDPQLEKMY